MLTNEKRREILETARAVGYKGSVLDLYNAARAGQDISQLLQPQNMEVAQTPEQQSQGLRPQHAAGNTNASMAFPDVPPNTPFNTKGMKAPINISKFDEQGHLVQSFKNVPPGIESLPTGPGKGTVIETPAYKKGGYRAKYQFGGRQGDAFQEVDTYIKPGQSTRPNWAQTPDAVTNYTFGKNLVDDESRFSLGLQGTDILDEIKYRADLIGSAGIGIGNRKGKSFRPAGENLRAGVRGQASWQGVPGNVLENMFPRSGVNVRGSFEGEAGLTYANNAISPYMSVTPQTNFSLNDNLSLGVGYEMRGRYDKNRNNPIYGSTGTGTVAPLSQRDAYSGMGRGAGRLSLKYDMGDGDFVEGYYSKPNSLYQGSMYPVPGVIALENEGPRFGVRLKKSF